MDAYAGYYKNEKLKESTSGGAASAIAEGIIKNRGIVFGVMYSMDFHSVEYSYAEKAEALSKFKGSKYVFSNKWIVKNGRRKLVYEEVIDKLRENRLVLFIGLGCDIAALKKIIKKEAVSEKKLYTIELLCDGVANLIVQEKYVLYLERMYKSFISDFNVRYKKDGWARPYIYARFENGKEHIHPFHTSDYGFAFSNYKRKACYECSFKDENHVGDLIIGDFWGCKDGMEEYNPDGVSLILERTEKGNWLIRNIDSDEFFLIKTDLGYALNNNPRYFSPHNKYDKWLLFDEIIRVKGLQEAVRTCLGISVPKRFRNEKNREIILWGTGNCFHRYISFIHEMIPILCVVDSDESKWEKDLEFGITCKSPDVLVNMRDIFVLIMVENISVAFQIVNQLLDMGITEFDYINNWIYYSDLVN